jgi:Plastocyanin
MTRPLRAVVPVLLAVLVGCGDDGPERSAMLDAALPSPTVIIERSRFATPELRVPVGTTVRFENRDEFAHTVTSVDGAPVVFDSGELGEGAEFEITFDQPGTYDYVCEIHPTMRGTVLVG